MKRTKTSVIAALMLLMLLMLASQAQAQGTVQIIWTRASTDCPLDPQNFVLPVSTPITLGGTDYNNGITCVVDGNINASNWPTSGTIDTATGPYLSYFFTPVSPTTIVFDGVQDKADVNGVVRDADGPQSAQLYFQHTISGTPGPLTAVGAAFTVLETSESVEHIFPGPTTVNPGETMEYRLYAWNATTTSGTLELNSFDVLSDDTLPVELTSFEATVDGPAVVLEWETASETNNAGFEIHARSGASGSEEGAWEVMGFVDGNGTTAYQQSYQYRVEDLEPGRHVFRLKQIDYDGTFEYHPEVETLVELPTTYWVSAAYPNPFNPEAQFRVSIAQRQQVTVTVYNILGQVVAELFKGTLDADATRTFTIEGSQWQSGMYVYRVQGETFSVSRPVLLVK